MARLEHMSRVDVRPEHYESRLWPEFARKHTWASDYYLDDKLVLITPMPATPPPVLSRELHFARFALAGVR